MALSYRDRCRARVTVVSDEFIDEHMAKASGEYVKVYLYLLRHEGEDVTAEDIAAALDHTEADVRRALRYWEKAGVLEAESAGAAEPRRESRAASREAEAVSSHAADAVSSRTAVSAKSRAADEPRAEEAPAKESRAAAPELLGRLSQDENFTQLIYIAQKYLEKVFTPRDCEVFAYLYGQLKMNADLLEYLVEHCAQAGHTSIRYIETVALDWHRQGIKTAVEAKEYSAGFQKDAFAVMRAFGLGDRRPGNVEREYIERWFRTYGFTKELVLEACSRTLAAIHNPSFQYADKILSQWKEAGVTGMDSVRKLDEKRAARSKEREDKRPARTKSQNRFHNYEQDSYDYDEMVWKMIREQQA